MERLSKKMLQTPTRIHSSGMSWRVVLDVLLPQRGIPTFTKFNDAVELSRSWDGRLGRAIWSKIYRNGYELAAFNEWEFDVLKRLAQFKVPNTYKAIKLERDGTPLASDVVFGTKALSQITIKTEHEGPTLADIIRMPTYSDGEILAHYFVSPRRYLRLARALLIALGPIHRNHFVHCDIHAGNIAIPVAELKFDGDVGSPSQIVFEPRVDKLKFIDFGFSIDRRSPPYTTLPFLRSGYDRKISHNFASILDEVDRQGKMHLRSEERWNDVVLNPVFWRRITPNPLNLLCQIDYREDIYQLGTMLADLRDGCGEFSCLGGDTISVHPESEIGRFIYSFPELLKSYALENPSATDEASPYLPLVRKIDDVLEYCSISSETGETINLKRSVFDCFNEDDIAHTPVNTLGVDSDRDPLNSIYDHDSGLGKCVSPKNNCSQKQIINIDDQKLRLNLIADTSCAHEDDLTTKNRVRLLMAVALIVVVGVLITAIAIPRNGTSSVRDYQGCMTGVKTLVDGPHTSRVSESEFVTTQALSFDGNGLMEINSLQKWIDEKREPRTQDLSMSVDIRKLSLMVMKFNSSFLHDDLHEVWLNCRDDKPCIRLVSSGKNTPNWTVHIKNSKDRERFFAYLGCAIDNI